MAEGQTPPQPLDLSAVQEAIKSSLNEALSPINQRFDEINETIETLKAVQPPPPGESGWAPKSWDEFPAMAQQKAQEIVDQKFAEAQKAQEEATAQQEAQKKAIDEEFDKALASLETQGKIPKIENPADENDAGRAARKELFGLGVRFDSPNLYAMAELREMFHKQGMEYDPRTTSFVKTSAPAYGKSAPVGSSSRSGGTSGTEPAYKDIHRMSMDALVQKFGQE